MNGSPSMRTDWDFDSLIAPLTRAAFIAEHWERKPLYVKRGDRAFYRGLLSMSDVDFMLTTHLGKADFPVALVGWKTGLQGEKPRKPDARHLDMEKVAELLAQGATLRIGNTPNYLPRLRDLANVFEGVLNSPVAINLYLTPRNSNAFGAHIDNHDVYILQLEGRKHWRLYEPPEDLPMEVLLRGRHEIFGRHLPDSRYLNIRPPVGRVTDLILEPGDFLYVPRGFVHEVRTGDSQSLHLTVGAPTLTWYEVLLNALPAALPRHRLLRQGLPPGFAADATARAAAAAMAEEVAASLGGLVTPAELTEALDDLTERFVYTRTLPPRGLAADVDRLDEIGVDAVLEVRRGLIYTRRRVREQIVLLFARRLVRLPVRAASMIDHIAGHPCFRVGDLPTQLGDNSRLAVVRALVKQGFLEVVETAGGQRGACAA